MPSANRTEIFDADINNVYETIIDYDSYPDFVDGVSSVDVLEKNEEGARVEYALNLIKKFKYTLRMEHNRPNGISWSFESGDIFKKNSGSWELKDLGDGRTEVTYNLDLDIKGFVPGGIVKKLTSSSLPAMMDAYHERAKHRG